MRASRASLLTRPGSTSGRSRRAALLKGINYLHLVKFLPHRPRSFGRTGSPGSFLFLGSDVYATIASRWRTSRVSPPEVPLGPPCGLRRHPCKCPSPLLGEANILLPPAPIAGGSSHIGPSSPRTVFRPRGGKKGRDQTHLPAPHSHRRNQAVSSELRGYPRARIALGGVHSLVPGARRSLTQYPRVVDSLPIPGGPYTPTQVISRYRADYHSSTSLPAREPEF